MTKDIDEKIEETKEEKPQKTEKPKDVGVRKEEKKQPEAIEASEEEMPKKNDMADELPDDVKKRLEKRQADRAKSGAKSKKKKKKKVDKKFSLGKAYIKATYNNTIVSITDNNGNVVSWASAGIAGFKGPKKSTPYAAQIIARIAVDRAKEFGLEEVHIFVKGVGTGREAAIRSINANGINIKSIKDLTPMPHNGCRARKPRRV